MSQFVPMDRAIKQRCVRVFRAITQSVTTTRRRPEVMALTVGGLVDYMTGHRTGLSSVFKHYNADKLQREAIGYSVHDSNGGVR